MKRFLFVAVTLLVTILLLSPALRAGADDKLPPSVPPEQETTDYLPVSESTVQPVNNSPRELGQIYLIEETFEFDFPGSWTVYDCDGSTNGEYFWDDTDYKPWAGSWSAWVADEGADGFTPNDSSLYPNYMCAWMVSGPYDLRGVASGSFFLKYWLDSELGEDFFKFMVSINGTNFYGYVNSGNTAGWVDGNMNLASVPTLGNVLGDSSVWVAIKFDSDESVQRKGAYVDNVYLEVTKTCYRLFQYVGTGSGSPSTAVPDRSGICDAGRYHAGEQIALTAHPDAGWSVSSWDGTNNDTLTTLTNTVTMPAQDQLVVVNYSQPTYTRFYSDGVQDGWILESGETTTQGGTLGSTATTFNLGDDSADKQYRAILPFNTASLPDDAIVTQAILSIRKQGLVGSDPFFILGGLMADIRKPYFGTTSGLVVSDFQATASRNQVAKFRTTPVSSWYSAVIASAGYPFINLTGLTQFRLRFQLDDNNNNINDYMKFYSGNYTNVNSQPRLTVWFTDP